MTAPHTTHEVMAMRTSRWRPRRIDTSLPATLAHVPTRPMAVATTVGASHGLRSPVALAT
jgi:hypothetical protein